MNRLFFTICFIICSNIFMSTANARVESIVGPHKPQPVTSRAIPNNMPDPKNEEEVRAFFKKRLAEAARSTVSKDVDLTSINSVNVIHSQEYYANKQEQEKPFYQKVYEKALASLNGEEKDKDGAGYTDDYSFPSDEQIAQEATRFFTIEKPAEVKQPQVPTVALTLPSGRRILAPAREHIPYFLSYIDIQANGYIKIEDTALAEEAD